MIGLSAALMFLLYGRIAGVSGMASRLLPPTEPGAAPRLAFLGGIAAAPLAYGAAMGQLPTITIAASPMVIALAGVLVGVGTVLGNGCTSGHGVCGLSRLSRRSMAATGVFMVVAVLTVLVARKVM
jgi:uncharacterized membrane protein YedE/YeeE